MKTLIQKYLKKFPRPPISSKFKQLCIASILVVLAATPTLATIQWEAIDFNHDNIVNSLDLAYILSLYGCPSEGICATPSPTPTDSLYTSCQISQIGANVQEKLWSETHPWAEENVTEVLTLSQEYPYGFAGALNASIVRNHFSQIPNSWHKAAIANSLDLLTQNANDSTLPIDYSAYGPERLAGVPLEEQQDLPGSILIARSIADNAGKKLQVGYSTKQLHLEACERTEGLQFGDPCTTQVGWDNLPIIINLLAPHADSWIIQAADEYNNPNDQVTGNFGPILSQRHFPPGPEWRAQVNHWVSLIKQANPSIKIWIQLALHRIAIEGQNYPDAALVLDYREWLVNEQYGPPLVDGVLISSFYSWGIEPDADPPGHEVADAEFVEAFRCACNQQCAGVSGPTVTPQASPTLPPPSPTPLPDDNQITIVEEGWTDNVSISGLTLEKDLYYRIFQHSKYTCGDGGPYQFIVYDTSADTNQPKHLLVKFPGGGIGFYYYNTDGTKTYFINPNAQGILTSNYARNTFFRTAISAEYADGLTKKLRQENLKGLQNIRLAVMSYCSHDFYHGTGQFHATDNFSRYGYLTGIQAINHIDSYYQTNNIITFGGSSGAANYFIGKDLNKVVGIIMDSQAGDLSALSTACENGISIHGPGEACYCPLGGPQCHAEFASRVGFTLGQDEPYHDVEAGRVNKPIYLIWNTNDASRYAYLEYENLHQALTTHNPGGYSVANQVCITNPLSPPGPTCNLHVPTAYSYDYLVHSADTITASALVDAVYDWTMARLGEL